MEKQEKLKALKERLKAAGRLAVAFSGGTDSGFLLKTAHDVLGADAIAVTAKSFVFPEREFAGVMEFCRSEGIRLVTADVDVLEIPGFRLNPPDRCYLCKRAVLSALASAAAANGFPVLAEGSNADDAGEYRPGSRAVAELGVLSPLSDAGLSKQEIRALAREAGLGIWNKPSAPCLATRIPYGDEITPEKLRAADMAESFLSAAGLKQVRVRVHGGVARIETSPDDFPLVSEKSFAEKVNSYLRTLGFDYVALDLGGYVSGSMDRLLGGDGGESGG